MSFFINEWVPSSVAGKNVLIRDASVEKNKALDSMPTAKLLAMIAEKNHFEIVKFEAVDPEEFVNARLDRHLIVMPGEFWPKYKSDIIVQCHALATEKSLPDMCQVALQKANIICFFGSIWCSEMEKINEKFNVNRKMTEIDMALVQACSRNLQPNECLVFDFVKSKIFLHTNKE